MGEVEHGFLEPDVRGPCQACVRDGFHARWYKILPWTGELPSLCLPTVGPIARLTLQGQWRDLLSLARWPLIMNKFPAEVRDGCGPPEHESREQHQLNPHRLQYMADQIKQWSVGILGSADGPEEVKFSLEGSVRFLESAACGLQHLRHVGVDVDKRSWKYPV